MAGEYTAGSRASRLACAEISSQLINFCQIEIVNLGFHVSARNMMSVCIE